MIIQRIDESLARGDKDAAEKGKAILKRINPSAEHAVTCVLGNAKFGGLNQDLDPNGRPQGSYFGPLSGVDYGKQDELKKHGNLLNAAAIVIPAVIAIAGIIVNKLDNASNREEAKKSSDKATEEAAKVRINKEIGDFLGCNLGADACSALYPDGAKAVKNATENIGESKGTSGPGKPIESSPDDMWAPSVKQGPVPGSGGGSGELVPSEDMPIKIDNSHRQADLKDWQKNRYPQASARFCESTVRDYKIFATKKIAGPRRPTEIPTKALDPIATGAFGVMRWTLSTRPMDEIS